MASWVALELTHTLARSTALAPVTSNNGAATALYCRQIKEHSACKVVSGRIAGAGS